MPYPGFFKVASPLSSAALLLGMILWGLTATALKAQIPATPITIKSWDTAPADTFSGAKGDSMLIDHLGQLYVWTPDHSLSKRSIVAESRDAFGPEFRYRNVRFGKLSFVDLSNPLRPLLFYADNQVVVWLDRNLAELRVLELISLNLGLIDAVAYAPNDGIWVYSADRQRLYLVDRLGEQVQSSPQLQQTFNQGIRGRVLVATPSQVTLATQDGRVLVFGPFGAYKRQIFIDAAYLLPGDEQLLIHDRQHWYAYTSDYMLREIQYPDARGDLMMWRGDYRLWREGLRYWIERL